jgi:hypothetical protein
MDEQMRENPVTRWIHFSSRGSWLSLELYGR